MNTSRRLFLKNGGVALAAIGASSLFTPRFLGRMALAADSGRRANSRKVLICVFQRGAADGLSMVVPHGDPYYYKYRQEIALARPARSARRALRSISTASSPCIRRWMRSCRSTRPGIWRSCMPADRPILRGRTSTCRTLWSPARTSTKAFTPVG